MRFDPDARRVVATALALAALLACGPASAQIALIVQDESPQGQPFWTDVLDEAGVGWVTTAGSQLATVPLESYDLVVIAGFQAADFNQHVDAAAGRLEDYLAAEGDLLLVTATYLPEAAVTTLPHGTSQQHGAEFASDEAVNVAPSHPIMDGIPATLTGQPVSHGVYDSLGHATALTTDGAARPTSYLLEAAAGVAYVTSLTFETDGYDPVADLMAANAVDHLLHGAPPGDDDDDDTAGDDDDSAGDDDDSVGDDDDSSVGDDDDASPSDDDDSMPDDDDAASDDDMAGMADASMGCGPSCDGRGGGFTFGFLLPLIGLLGLRRR